MTKTTCFAPSRELILVTGAIEGPRGETEIKLVLDTGASQTIIVPEILDDIGYGARDGEVTSSVSTAIGREHGYALRVARFATLGFAMNSFLIHVFDLEMAENRIDGLIGLSFLHRFNYHVRSAEGCILVENLAPLAA
jgi:predicted aspartyl protease